jgi:hypothetical protein
LLIILAIVITGVACGRVEISSLLGLSPATSSQEAQPTVADEATAAPNGEKRFTVGPNSASSGLDQLTSYRANLILDFEGTRSGEPTAGHIESLTEVNRPQAALHQYLNIDATIPQARYAPGVSEFFQVDNKVYTKSAEEQFWFAVAAGSQASPGKMGFFELDKLITLPGFF